MLHSAGGADRRLCTLSGTRALRVAGLAWWLSSVMDLCDSTALRAMHGSVRSDVCSWLDYVTLSNEAHARAGTAHTNMAMRTRPDRTQPVHGSTRCA